MKSLSILSLSIMLGSCYAGTEMPSATTTGKDIIGRPIALLPTKTAPSSPAVVTTKGIMAYQVDLEACRVLADKRLGTDGQTDDVDAVLRAIGDKPVEGSLSVKYESTDVTTKRDDFVKTCLSSRGYVLKK